MVSRILKKRFNMKKIILVLVIFVVVLNGCQVSNLEVEESIEEAQPGDIIQAGEGLPVEYRSLSDIQIEACNMAHEAGTCDTRLEDLGIVIKEECCEVLGKCCQ